MSGSALRITALLVCPMGVGLFVMGRPIMQLLYPALENDVAGPLLSTLGLATVFVCMMMVCNSILQAYGFVNLPVLVMLLWWPCRRWAFSGPRWAISCASASACCWICC